MPETSASVPSDQASSSMRTNSQDVGALRVQERHGAIELCLISRTERTEQLAIAVAKFLGRQSPLAPLEGAERDGLFIFASGPTEYRVLADRGVATQALLALQEIVAEDSSTFDQSESRRIFLLSGGHVFDVLAKGAALDLASNALPMLGATHTTIAHIPVFIAWRRKPDALQILVPRSYVESFILWLNEAMTEYEVASEDDDRRR